jgi:hypothetical protein
MARVKVDPRSGDEARVRVELGVDMKLELGLGLRGFLLPLVSNLGLHGPIATSCSLCILQISLVWRGWGNIGCFFCLRDQWRPRAQSDHATMVQ